MKGNIKVKNLSEIKKYANENLDQEICGIITHQNGAQKFVKCQNISNDTEKFFLLDPVVYVNYDIDAVVHSHCLGSARPSGLDRKCADEMEIPFLIYSTIDDEFCLYNNKSVIYFKV